jgi:hypothetical protein
MQGGDEARQERLEQLDEESFEGGQELVHIRELQYALIRDLAGVLELTRRMRGGGAVTRTTKMSSSSFTNVHLTANPSFSYRSSVVRPSMRASRTSEFTGDAGEVASRDASGVKERDQRTTPPEQWACR